MDQASWVDGSDAAVPGATTVADHLAVTSAGQDTSVHDRPRQGRAALLRRVAVVSAFVAGAWLFTALGGAAPDAHADVPLPTGALPAASAGAVADVAGDAPDFPSGVSDPRLTALIRWSSAVVSTGTGVTDGLADQPIGPVTDGLVGLTVGLRQALLPSDPAGVAWPHRPVGVATRTTPSRPVRPSGVRALPVVTATAGAVPGTPVRPGPDRAGAAIPDRSGRPPCTPASGSGRPAPATDDSGSGHPGVGGLPVTTSAGQPSAGPHGRWSYRWVATGRLAGKPPVSPD